MQSSVLSVYDVSYLVHAGTKSQYKAMTIMGVPCGGIAHLMDKVFLHISQGNSVALAFDSRNDRKEMCKTFKANRVSNPEIYLQCGVLKQWCQRMGIPMFAKDGFEADEIIHNIVTHNSVDLLYSKIDIYSGDSDIAADLVSDKYRLIGVTTTTPTVTVDSYPFVFKKGAVVQYNSILPYILFMGKPSNNMDALKSESGYKPIELYKNYLGFCDKNHVPESDRSLQKWMRLWLIKTKKNLHPNDVAEITNRMSLVYPRDIPAEEVDVPLGPRQHIKRDEMIKFMHMFGLKFSAINMGVRDAVFAQSDLTTDEKRYFLNLKSRLESGDFAFDVDLPMDTNVGPVSDLDEQGFDDEDSNSLSDKLQDDNNPFTGLFNKGDE